MTGQAFRDDFSVMIEWRRADKPYASRAARLAQSCAGKAFHKRSHVRMGQTPMDCSRFVERSNDKPSAELIERANKLLRKSQPIWVF